ncbi:unnamed protein product, partial [Larinioides sclopetarius]
RLCVVCHSPLICEVEFFISERNLNKRKERSFLGSFLHVHIVGLEETKVSTMMD